jgi:hypothetical protein
MLTSQSTANKDTPTDQYGFERIWGRDMNSLRIMMAVSVAAAVSCGRPTSNSSVKHDDGKFARSELSANWMDMDRTTFITKVLEKSEKEAFSENSFTTKRLQTWIDKIDAYARTRDEKGMKGIPKPRVVVLKTDDANAFVASTPVCYNIPVVFGNGGKVATGGVYLDKEQDLLDTDIPVDLQCVDVDPSDLPAIAEEINSRNQKCSFTVSPKGVELSSTCSTLDSTYRNGFTTNKLIMLKTPNWFVVLSGIASLLNDEASLVGVLAHELGHYYRSHANSFQGDYDFFYTLNEKGNDHQKPKADKSLASFGKQVMTAASELGTIGTLVSGPKYKVDPVMFLALGDIARQANGVPSCDEAASYDSGTKGADLLAIPFTAPLNNNFDTYNSFVDVAMACLNDLDAKANIDVKAAFLRPKWAPFLKNPAFKGAQAQLKVMVSTIFPKLGNNVAFPAKPTKEAMEKTAEKMLLPVVKLKEVLMKAYDSKLGQYTAEQEADDISAEVLSKIGLGGEAAVDTYMALLSDFDGLSGFEIGRTRCEQMRANNWEDPTGQFDMRLLPIGDYSEVHHSGCYRAFNASRELAAHDYSKAGKGTLDKAIWEKIKRELATKVGFAPKKDKRVANVGKMKRLVFPKSCIFTDSSL